MTDEQEPPSTGRRSFIKEIVGGAVTIFGMVMVWRQDQREQEKHEWARADRPQGRIVRARASSHSHSSGRAVATVVSSSDRGTIPI